MTTKLNRSDLKFYPSERLDDRPDSGGLALGTPIKGEANEIFNPISSLERVNGGFAMRLIYTGVQRADDEPLIGANVAITKPPMDESVSYLLTHAQFGELRKSGVSKVEGYVTQSFESNLTLLSSPPKGSKMIQAYTRVGEKLPSVGDRFCLSQAKRGYEQATQYINIIKVESTERTFTDGGGFEFNRLVVRLELSQPLAYDFIGADYPSRYYVDNPCKIRETSVSDSSRYFGVKPLTQAVQAGAMTLKVPSLMAKIVPTAVNEVALMDKMPTPTSSSLIKQEGVLSWDRYLGNPDKLQLPPFMVGSLVANTSGGRLTDKDGKLMQGDNEIGIIEYHTGLVLINANARHNIHSLTIAPVLVTYAGASETHAMPIELNNRGYTHTLNLPNIGVGSLAVRFMASGKWYELKDNGRGQLVGSSVEHGTGAVNYQTGTISITCGQLPDVGSSILLSWGAAPIVRAIDKAPLIGKARFKLSDNAKMDSITLQMGNYRGRVGKNGKITGQFVGEYDKLNNELWVEVGNHNWANAYSQSDDKTMSIGYTKGELITKELSLQNTSNNQMTVKLSDTPIVAGSVNLFVNAKLSKTDTARFSEQGILQHLPTSGLSVSIDDDGNGNLLSDGRTVGTIDYDTAVATFAVEYQTYALKPITKTEQYQVPTPTTIASKGKATGLLGAIIKSIGTITTTQNITHTRTFYVGNERNEVTLTLTGESVAKASFYAKTDGEMMTETLPINAVYVKIPKANNEMLLSGSVRLDFGMDKGLYDNLGILYKNYDPITGQGTVVGNVDYQAGLVSIRQLNGFAGGYLQAAQVGQNIDAVNEMHFATALAPIRPNSLQVVATTTDGQTIRATANLDGTLQADGIQGTIDVKTGVAHIRFGKWVTAAGNENKVWYDPKAVIDGEIWQPMSVLADSIRYNAVATSELPIDSSIIKIDAVRLPQDGQVPIFRTGDTILIGNRQTTDIGSAFTGGQVVRLPRQNLDRICVKDSTGKPLDANLYDDDLENGTVTFKSPLDLSGYKLPLVAMHAVEEKNRVANTDIDGTITLMFPLKNSYETDNTYVSSVLAHGNLQVNSSIPFTQKNWNSKWADEPNGDPLLNRLNVKDYPIILTDDGAINERWLIKFTGSTQFELYGETLGFVMRTDILQNLAPINPSTGKPYFTLDKRAFGGSDSAGSQGQVAWASQDVIRFNTEGTLLPIWVIRAVSPSQYKQVGDDGFGLCIFGDTTQF